MADPGTSSVLAKSRPTLMLDGVDQPELTQGLLSLLVEETALGLSRCELTFGNWGTSDEREAFLYFKRDVIEFGRALLVKLGEGDTEQRVFEGRIMGLEAHYPQTKAPEIALLAEDRFQDLRMTRRSRSFEDISDGDAIRQIAGEHGLQAEIDLDGPTHRVLAQVNQSDLAFIRERARAVDGHVWLREGKLHAQARARRDGGEVEMTYGRGLFEFSVLADLAGQRTSTVISGWSVDGKEGVSHEADDSGLIGEMAGLIGGPAILREKIGARVERMVHFSATGDDEVRALANAHQHRSARAFVTGTGLAEGDGRVAVGSKVKIKGLGPLFEGAYFVTEVCHLFDQTSGYRTQFRVERPGIGRV